MSDLDQLMAAGASCVAGTLVQDNVTLGALRAGGVHLNEAGLARLTELNAATASGKKAAPRKKPDQADPAPEELLEGL